METNDIVISGLCIFFVTLLLICFGIMDQKTKEQMCEEKNAVLVTYQGKEVCVRGMVVV